MRQLILSFLIFISCWTISSAQWNIGVTIGGLAYHQGKVKNPDIYPTKIDSRGKFVIFRGINISLSYQFNDYVGVKAVQTLIFHDSAGKFAGISHLGLQLHDDIAAMDFESHHLSMSIGPFLYYRKGWNNIEGYTHDPHFIKMSTNGEWESKFVWYGGFMRYDYNIDSHTNLAFDLLPGFPFVYALTSGWSTNF